MINFFLFVLGMGTDRDVFQGDTRTSTHTPLFVLQQLLMVEAGSAYLTDTQQVGSWQVFLFYIHTRPNLWEQQAFRVSE